MKLKKHRFHSTVLIPQSLIEETNNLDPQERENKIEDWKKNVRSSYYFKEGDYVYDEKNLNTPLCVYHIARKTFKKNGKTTTRIEGVDAHWWEPEN